MKIPMTGERNFIVLRSRMIFRCETPFYEKVQYDSIHIQSPSHNIAHTQKFDTKKSIQFQFNF